MIIANNGWVPTNNGWISIDDALPPNNKRVLLLFIIKDNSENGAIIFRTIEELKEFNKKRWPFVEIMTVEEFMQEKGDNYLITHWMPIPRLTESTKEFL